MVSSDFLHRIVTALAWRPVGALVSISKRELRMWGGGLERQYARRQQESSKQQGGHNSGLKETRHEV
jgi:hypothetical protein